MIEAAPPQKDVPGSATAVSFLQRIPLALRMLVYASSFLLLMLVGLPWAFYRIDVHFPALHVEIGWLRAVGVVLFAVCAVIYFGASWVLTRQGKGAYVEFDPPTQLVVEGPFRYSRNPVAATLVGMVLGEAIMLSSSGVFLLFLLLAVLVYIQVTRIEEPLLGKRYGRAFEEYCLRVPRWMPAFGRGRASPLPLRDPDSGAPNSRG